MEPLRQQVVIEVVAPKVASPLSGLVAHLKKVDEYLERIAAKTSATFNPGPAFSKSVAEIADDLKKAVAVKGPYGVTPLARALGLDDASIQSLKRRLNGMQEELAKAGLTTGKGISFPTLEKGARALHMGLQKELAAMERDFAARFKTLQSLLSPTPAVSQVSGVAVKAQTIQAGVEGVVPLVIPAAQIRAVVEGVVPVASAGSVSGATAASGAMPTAEETRMQRRQRPMAGEPRGGPPGSEGEIARTVVQTQRGSTLIVESALEGGRTIAKTFDDFGNEIMRVTKDPKFANVRRRLSEQLGIIRRESEALWQSQVTGDRAKDLQIQARVQRSAAERVRRAFREMEKHIPEPLRRGLANIYESHARTLEGRAGRSERMAQVVSGRAAAAADKVAARALMEEARQRFEERMFLASRSRGPEARRRLAMAEAHETYARDIEAVAQMEEASASRRARLRRQAAEQMRLAQALRAPLPPAAEKQLQDALTSERRRVHREMAAARTGDRAKDLETLSQLKESAARNIRESFRQADPQLSPSARARLSKIYEEHAATFEAEAKEARARAKHIREKAQPSADAARRDALRAEAIRAKTEFDTEKARIKAAKLDDAEARARLADAHRRRADVHDRLAREQVLTQAQRASHARIATLERQRAELLSKTTPGQSFMEKIFGGDGRLVTRGLVGFTPAGFTKNLLTVTAWTSAVGALYSVIGLARYSLERFVEIGLQTARLSQVFRGVGGSAKELADDVIRLSVVTGRNSQEAIESAVAWSRLGLTRRGVNEAVRVSLMAANVAEMTAAQSTEHLAAITAVYRLRVNELEGALGQLNQVSNTARVTNRDLLEGLSNVAAVGRSGGFGLSELIGLIGASVEISGQTGSRMGNALKNILSRMSRPDVQEFMRRQGVEIQTPGGEEKSRAQIFRELFMAYSRMNDAERTNLAVRVAGANQANRFAAIMHSYLRAQQLAIDAQMHLNSAQEENIRITGTLRAQWQSLKSEWDRFVVSAPSDALQAPLIMARRAIRPGAWDWLTGDSPEKRARREEFWGQFRERFFSETERTGKPPNKRKLFAQMQEEQLKKGGPLLFSGAEVLVNYDLLDRLTRGQHMAANLSSRLVRMRSGAQAMREQADLYQVIENVLKSGRSDIAGEAVRIASATLGENFGSLTREEQVTLLQQKRAELQARSVEQTREYEAEQSKVVEQLDREIAMLRQKNAEGKSNRETQRQLLELEETRRDAAQAQAAITSEYINDLERIRAAEEETRAQRQENFDLMQRQQSAAELLARFSKQVSPVSQLDESVQKADLLRAEVEQLESVSASNLFQKFATEHQKDEIERKIKETRARLAAEEDPTLRAGLQQFDRRAALIRRAEETARHAGVGITEADRLLARERELSSQVRRFQRAEGERPLTESEVVTASVLERQHWQTVLEIQKRIRDLAYEEKQAKLEGVRAFKESLLLSGPGEILKKLAALKLSEQPMNAGRWFGLSPEIRREIDMLRGGPEARRIREERNSLRRIPAMTPEQEAQFSAQSPRFRPPLPHLQTPERLETAKTQQELLNVAGAARALTGALAELRRAVGETMRAFAAPARPPAAANGINTGFALGATPGVPFWTRP